MICPVCNGSGVTRVKLSNEIYTLPPPCGGCRGTGVLSEVPDTRPLYDRMIAKQVEIGQQIAEVRRLPSDLRRRWCDRLELLSVTQTNAETVLRDLRTEIEAWHDIADCDVSLITYELGELSRMCADHQRLSG